ncbi:AAA family ATPase [Leadbettera azotonutricia]|uniref:AAA+ ATPase domain-containing protein n=1 Tax=Leadbettera azotonutricia (strain ATCC BAA-888 / DSM 13862 / ZAS-9) TaxID=545695 RepID=F5YDG8_LEAAZ|nr:AAA family ATPase [Leadbettera azotonutricia]AEF80737.1 conserved hypothetical protein [Leadbettera azotonutricia ZAS-9]
MGILFKDLMQKVFPTAIWVVEKLITNGLTLVLGASKIGKSWFVLQLAIDIDNGSHFLGELAVQKLGIIYFALEDTEARIQRRLTKLGIVVFNDAWLETTWEKEIIKLKTYLQDKPKYKVVIIDTLQKFAKISDLNAYGEVVKALGLLKSIADELGIAIIAIHHTRKGVESGTGDWMDGGLGSMGINGTADCTITLTRKRESSEGFLRATGRDIEDIHWALNWDKKLCIWTKTGNAPKNKLLSVDQQIIIDILQQSAPESLETSDIAKKAGKSEQNTINILKRMGNMGFVTKTSRGLWSANKLTNSLSLGENELVNLALIGDKIPVVTIGNNENTNQGAK